MADSKMFVPLDSEAGKRIESAARVAVADFDGARVHRDVELRIEMVPGPRANLPHRFKCGCGSEARYAEDPGRPWCLNCGKEMERP